MPTEDLKTLVEQSGTYSAVLLHWGLENKGHNCHILKARIAQESIDDSHIRALTRGEKASWKTSRPLAEYLVLNGPYVKGGALKRKLIKAGLKTDQCEECCQPPMWNNKPLALQIDHINGNRHDNRIENLRILCPHCHSQTPTFAGRNTPHSKKHKCPECNEIIAHQVSRCRKCANAQPRPAGRKIPHPTAEELSVLIWSKPIVQLAQELGVSDVAIHKWCKRLSVEKPPRGYFQRNQLSI